MVRHRRSLLIAASACLAFAPVVVLAGAPAPAPVRRIEPRTETKPPVHSAVLEPSTLILVGLGLVGLAIFRSRASSES